MALTRTQTIFEEAGRDFTVDVPVTKAYVGQDGRRHIVGVATGVAEDRDGERCSVNCIKGMGRDIESGIVKVTASHQQDWMTEIGDVEKYAYNAETDEMEVDGVLPPEGVDPIADKAWREANAPNSRLAWSIGGKLLKHFYERNEVGKKRKVLDAIRLRHCALTKNPSYPHSFANAVVAKTFDGDSEPGDDEFTLEAEVEKADATGSWVGGGSDAGGGNTGRDSVGSGQRNAGSKSPKSKGMNTEDDGSNKDDDDTKDLPEGKDQERHLACPNCGHEFAADLPVDPEERQVDETNDHDNDDEDEDRETGKSLNEETATMSKLTDTLDELRALAEPVEKTDEKPEDASTVAKTATDLSDVEKMVAASHRAHEERFASVEEGIGKGFELVAKAIQGLNARLDELPQGRKSTAIAPGRLAPTTGHGEASVEKTAEQEIEEAPDAATAIKAMNARHPAYSQYH